MEGAQMNEGSCNPKITVIVLAFNQVDYIETALSSIVEQSSGSYDLEIIVTDDGSTDGTADVIKEFQNRSAVPIIFNSNLHEGVEAIAKNLLFMINQSSGDYIAFLAGDDYYAPDRFERQVRMMESDRNIKILYSDGVNRVNGDVAGSCHSRKVVDLIQGSSNGEVYQYLTTEVPLLFMQGMLARADFLKEIQPFDVDLIADDWVFNIKVFSSLVMHGGKADFIDEAYFVRNIHGDNTSRNLVIHYERVSQVAERYCSTANIIKSKFIGSSIVSAARSRNKETLLFFIKKIPASPSSLFYAVEIIFKKLMVKVKR